MDCEGARRTGRVVDFLGASPDRQSVHIAAEQPWKAEPAAVVVSLIHSVCHLLKSSVGGQCYGGFGFRHRTSG